MKSLWRFSWHVSNENEKYEYEGAPLTYGSIWRSFRFWLYYDIETKGKKTRTLSIEWNFLPTHKFWHAYLECGERDEQVTIALALGLFSLWISFGNIIPEVLLPKKKCQRQDGQTFYLLQNRQIGFSYGDEGFHLYLWRNPMEWSSKDPWWWEINFYPLQLLIGQHSYEAVDLYEEMMPLPLPEQTYLVRVVMQKSIRTRPRWFKKVSFGGEMFSDTKIPMPTKDGGVARYLDRLSRSGNNPAEVIGNTVAYILHERHKRWKRYEP